jgi:hypothetical protein
MSLKDCARLENKTAIDTNTNCALGFMDLHSRKKDEFNYQSDITKQRNWNLPNYMWGRGGDDSHSMLEKASFFF